MNVSTFIALRYLFAKKSRNVINLISGISMVVVAAVAAAMITILSAFNGIDNLVEGLFMNFDADLTVTPARGRTFHLDSISIKSIEMHKAVERYALSLEEDAILSYGENKSVVTVKAIDAQFDQVCPLSNSMREGSYLDFDTLYTDALLGYGVKMQMNIPFDPERPPVVQLNAPVKGRKLKKFRESAFQTKAFNVTGIYSINAELDSKYAVISMADARKLYGLENEAGAVEIKLKAGTDADRVRDDLKLLLGPDFAVKTRHEKNALVYQTNQSEKWAAFAMLLFILLIAAFNIMASLTMLVIEKKKDVAVLLSMGADKSLIRRIFFLEGMLINVLGAGGGLALGLLLCWAQMRFGLIRLEGSIIPYYPVAIKGSDLLLVGGAVVALALVSNWFLVRFLVSRHALTVKS